MHKINKQAKRTKKNSVFYFRTGSLDLDFCDVILPLLWRVLLLATESILGDTIVFSTRISSLITFSNTVVSSLSADAAFCLLKIFCCGCCLIGILLKLLLAPTLFRLLEPLKIKWYQLIWNQVINRVLFKKKRVSVPTTHSNMP